MKINMPRRNSIAFKLAIAFLISTFIQGILMSTLLIAGGVIDQAERNALTSLSEKVDNRKKNLQNEMNGVWTNFDQYTYQISQEFTSYQNETPLPLQSSDDILEKIAPFLIDALRTTKTTGVFFIMNDNKENDSLHSALYLRDSDPNKNSVDNSDLALMVGPWNVAKSTGIVTDKQWQLRLKLSPENENFYNKPYENKDLSQDKRLVSYWSPPFALNPNEEQIITYSLPLTDTNGNAIGVFGIEISINYLYQFLPANDLVAQDSYGYFIGISSDEAKNIQPLITRGVLQERILKDNHSLSLDSYEKNNNIYILNSNNDREEVYSAVHKLGMYYNNTPFEKEEWYLIGLMKKSTLFQFPNRITNILIMSLVVSLILGFLIAIGISKWFTKPIIHLANQVKKDSSVDVHPFQTTGLSEIDGLSASIYTSQKRLIALSAKLSRIIDLTNMPLGAFEISAHSNSVFMTNRFSKLLHLSEEEALVLSNDKAKFTAFLNKVYEQKTHNSDVFCLTSEKKKSWIRIIQTQTEDGILGIAIDVTQETLQANTLRAERDKDPLTKIRNRNAYNQNIFIYDQQLTQDSMIGIGVFDLNGLKYVNDHHGHITGDEYLCASCGIICSTFSHCPVFRIGGDEFVAILIGMNENTIESLHHQMIAKSKEYNQSSKFQVGIAFGYSFYKHGSDISLSSVFQRADANMYLNKQEMKRHTAPS